MAKKRTKCSLCGRNLKGNEWKWLIDSDGIERHEKVCINERACKARQKKQKEEVYEVPQEAKELEEMAATSDRTAHTELKTASISVCTRRYLEIVVAVLILVGLMALFCIIAKGGSL